MRHIPSSVCTNWPDGRHCGNLHPVASDRSVQLVTYHVTDMAWLCMQNNTHGAAKYSACSTSHLTA